MTRRILITGPRQWTDHATMADALVDARERFPHEPLVLVSGNASGFDQIAEHRAESFGWQVERHPVTAEDWATKGRGAAHARNSEMVALGADLCIAGHMQCTQPSCVDKPKHMTHGTKDCAVKAAAAGIPVRWYSQVPPSPPEPDDRLEVRSPQ